MKRRDAILIFLSLLLAYGYVLPRWADWSQNSRLNLVRALVEQGTTRIDAYVANTGDYAEFDGHAYTDKPPGLSFVGVPLYAVALPLIDHPAVASRLERIAGNSMAETLNPEGTGLNRDKIRTFVAQVLLSAVTVALPAAALGVLLYAVLGWLGFRRNVALLVTLAYGLATPAAIYAGNYYSHQFVAALLFGAFALLLTVPPTSGAGTLWSGLQAAFLGRRWGLGWARATLFGLLCGYALITEYPIALVIAALGVFALWRLSWRDLLVAAVAGLLPLALMAVYDYKAFGTIFPVGYSHSALWQDQHHTGFMSVTYPHPAALWGLTFGSFRGLFVRAPWLVLSLPGFVLWYRSGQARGALWVALTAIVSLTLFYGSSVMWWGGFGIGPRYLVPMLPFMALAAAYALAPLWQRLAGRIVTLGLVLASLLLTWAEGLARQGFPPDTIQRPWLDYTLPAWASGDIARNLGMVLGLRGSFSILPLLAGVLLLLVLLVVPRQGSRRRVPQTEELQAPVRV